MDQRAAPAPAAREAVTQHGDYGRELLARQAAVGRGAAHQVEQLVLGPLARADLGDDLLRKHVERFLGDRQAVELAAIDAIDQRGALDEIVAR